MKKNQKLTLTLAVMLAVALVVGLTSMATGTEGNQGTQADPLVTLSYLNDQLTPAILAELNQNLDLRSQELSDSLAGLLEGKDVPIASGFSVITLKKGQTLVCTVGTEIMLRVGTAVSAGPNNPRLIDETGGQNVSAAGTELVKNHMYMVTIVDNGIKATANTVKVLIRGDYTIQD